MTPPASAMAPSAGARATMTRLATELARPSRNVLSVTSAAAFQYCLKKSGKNPASTVVAKAELPQSYSAQDRVLRVCGVIDTAAAGPPRAPRPAARRQRRTAQAPAPAR